MRLYQGGSNESISFGYFLVAIYVLHAFQKKSKHGIATAKHDLDLIKTRLRYADEDYAARQRREGK